LGDRSEHRSDFRFRREERLKGRKEIREVFGKGKRYGCKGAKLIVLNNNQPFNRICFSFSKSKDLRFVNAVYRNRAKRIGREAFRLMKGRISNGHDLILLIYAEPDSGNASLSARIRGQLEFLFIKAGLLK